MKLAIIGGGWAGLSAAYRLYQQGHDVHVFEASHSLGGRARSVRSARMQHPLDNGQHILLGAYTEALALIQEINASGPSGEQAVPADELLYALPLALRSADGQFSMNVPDLPAPLHLAASLFTTRGLAWSERLRLAMSLHRLKRANFTVESGQTVTQWLDWSRQSARLRQHVWHPLCLAAMNTPPDHACAQLFANVLRDSLCGTAQACRVLIPRVGLSRLWPEPLAHLATQTSRLRIHRGVVIRELARHADTIRMADQDFDGVIVATNIPSALRLLQPLDAENSKTQAARRAYLTSLASFRFIPIATITLKLQSPWRPPLPMLMLNEDPEREKFGQWLFAPGLFMHRQTDTDESLLNIVVSNATVLQTLPIERVIQCIIEQLRADTSQFGPLPQVSDYELIVEKRATFAAVPGLARPQNTTPWPRIWVAGDWTDTGYPAVLEGAVRSGRHAARLIA